MMNSRIKKLWLRALRSRKYKQGKGQLKLGRKDPRHCCLGVLCEIAKAEGVIRTYDGGRGGLPEKVREWADLYSGLPYARGLGLHTMNDSGSSFKAIADRIEQYL